MLGQGKPSFAGVRPRHAKWGCVCPLSAASAGAREGLRMPGLKTDIAVDGPAWHMFVRCGHWPPPKLLCEQEQVRVGCTVP